MAYELPGFKATFTAGASQASNQHKLVKLSAANTIILCAAATDIPVGILQNDCGNGGAAEVMLSGISKLKAGSGGLTAGCLVAVSSTGLGIIADPDGTAEGYYFGQCIEAAAENGLATVAFSCFAPVLTSGS